LLERELVKNIFIFGEDPIGCGIDKVKMKKIISKINFKVVFDYFVTETAEMADLIIPASFPFENGGTYSNTQKYIVSFEKEYETKIKKKTYEVLIDLMSKFRIKNRVDLTNNISMEISSLLIKDSGKNKGTYNITYSENDNNNKLFKHGCDIIVKMFDDYFEKFFKN